MKEPMMAPGEALLVAARGDGPDAGLHRYILEGGDWRGGCIAQADGLSALARHPALPVVYGTAGSADGRLHAWRIEGEGARLLSTGRSGGDEPCALAVAPNGRALVVANYTSGTLALQRLSPEGGFDGPPETLALHGSGPDPERQEAAHPHQVIFDAGLLRVPDLGADLLRSYDAELSGGFVPRGADTMPPGTGPRHGVVLPDGRLAVTGELAATLVLGRPGAADWTSVPGSRRNGPARSRSPRNYPGDLQAAAAGGHVYFANRGHDTIATFDVTGPAAQMRDERDAGVAWPQHLLVHRGHLLVAGWDSGQIVAMPLEAGIPGPPRPILACAGACWLLCLTP